MFTIIYFIHKYFLLNILLSLVASQCFQIVKATCHDVSMPTDKNTSTDPYILPFKLANTCTSLSKSESQETYPPQVKCT